MYTVFRNKLPRPQGQGTSRQEKVFTGISGSQTGGQGVVDISIPELVQSTGTPALHDVAAEPAVSPAAKPKCTQCPVSFLRA